MQRIACAPRHAGRSPCFPSYRSWPASSDKKDACFCVTTSKHEQLGAVFRLFLVSVLLLRVLACPLVLFCVEGIGEVVALLTNSNSNRAGEHEHEHRIAAMQEQATLLPRILLEESEQARLWQLRRRKLRRCPTQPPTAHTLFRFERKREL